MADHEGRPLQVLAERLRPLRRDVAHWIEHLRIVIALHRAHAAAIDVEEAIAPRLDQHEQQHKQHAEKEHAVMRRRGRKSERQHRGANRDRPVGGAVDAVAPARHARDLRAVIVRKNGDVFAARLRKRRIENPHRLLTVEDHGRSPGRIMLPGRETINDAARQ